MVGSKVGVEVEIGGVVGEWVKGVLVINGGEVGVLNPAWEQASRKVVRAAARPTVEASRKNSLRVRLGFPSVWPIIASLNPNGVNCIVMNAKPPPT